MVDVMQAPWWPPGVDWKEWRVPPPANSYVRQDDYLAVSVLTSSTTTNLALRYRILTSSGQVHDGAETLDGASENTLKTFIFQLTEGFLLSATVSNIGGGLADSVCGVVMALQKGGQSSTPPHTILAQGFVSNIVGVTWPVGLPRGPATGGSLTNGSAAGDLIQWSGTAWAPFAANAAGTKVLQETSAGVASWGDPLAVWPALANHPDRPPATADAKDDEFDGASLNTSLWTWDNQGTAAATQSNSLLFLKSQAAPDTNLRSIIQAVSGASWTYAAKIRPIRTGAGDLTFLGFVLRETASASYTTYGFEQSQGTPYTNRHQVGHWSDNHTVSGYLTNTDAFFDQEPVYFRIRLASAVLYYEYSRDGANWYEFNHENVNAFFTAGPNSIGLTVCSYAALAMMSVDWFRKTA